MARYNSHYLATECFLGLILVYITLLSSLSMGHGWSDGYMALVFLCCCGLLLTCACDLGILRSLSNWSSNPISRSPHRRGRSRSVSPLP